jgi:hypothetical protein
MDMRERVGWHFGVFLALLHIAVGVNGTIVFFGMLEHESMEVDGSEPIEE